MNEQQKQMMSMAYSKEMSQKIQIIADKHSLHIDQMGELAAEIRDVITGVTSSKKFVSDIKERLEINDEKANLISEDVNRDIFEAIRASLQKMQEEKEKAIEKVGGFTIENKAPQSSSPLYKDTNLNREAVLKDIEDAGKKVSDSGVSLVDHLLKTSKPSAPVTPEIPKTPTPQPEIKKYESDPYREPIK